MYYIPLKSYLELNLFQLYTLMTLLSYTKYYQSVPLIPGSRGEALRVTWNINTSNAVLFPHIPQQCETRRMASLGEYCIVDVFRS